MLDVAAVDGCASEAPFVGAVRQALRCASRLDLSCMYDRSILSVARGIGRAFMPRFEKVVEQAGDV